MGEPTEAAQRPQHISLRGDVDRTLLHPGRPPPLWQGQRLDGHGFSCGRDLLGVAGRDASERSGGKPHSGRACSGQNLSDYP